jgi:hypothetical protein
MLWIRQRIKTNVLYKGKVEVITSEVLRSPPRLGRPLWCSTCRKHFLVISSFMTWFVTRLARRVPLVEQELLIFPEQLSSPPVFSGVRVTRSLVLCVCFVDHCVLLFFFFWPLCCLFLFDIRILITPLVSSSYSPTSHITLIV